MHPSEIGELGRLVKKLGEEIEATPKEAGGRERKPSMGFTVKDLYVPRVPPNFYCDPKVFRRLLGIRDE